MDASVDDVARDWLAVAPPAPPMSIAAASPAPVEAALPDTLDAFLAARMGGDAPEADWSPQRIAPTGAIPAELMILVDMPEEGDEASGTLLSGPAGKLLDSMLAAIGHDRSSVYLASVCTARPLAGRIPMAVEAELHRLARHLIGLAGPRQLLVLGDAAARVLGASGDRTVRRGSRELNQNGRSVPAIATLHPRYLLERPAAKAEAWKHLQLLIGESRP